MADSLTATIMAARMNSPSLPLFLSFLSLPLYSISFYLSFDPLFFLSSWTDLSFSFFLQLHMCTYIHPHTVSHATYTLRLLVVAPSLRPLPYLFPCPPHPVSVSGSNSGVSINLAITPRWISENGHVRHGGNGTRLRLYRCIHCRAYYTWSVRTRVCLRVGSVNTQQTWQTMGHQEWIRIKFVMRLRQRTRLRVYQQLEIRIVDVVPPVWRGKTFYMFGYLDISSWFLLYVDISITIIPTYRGVRWSNREINTII